MVAVGIALVLVGLAFGAAASPLLAIDRVVVRGTRHTTPAQVVAAGGVRRGDSLVWFDAGRAASGIRALPYVATARVTREWPHTVRVVVSERVAAAWFEARGGRYLIDGSGRVLAPVTTPPAGLPKILGVTRAARPGGVIRPTSGARAAAALPLLARLATASVTVARDGNVSIQLTSGVEVRLGEPSAIPVKVRAALAVLADLGTTPTHYVDVSAPTNPVAG